MRQAGVITDRVDKWEIRIKVFYQLEDQGSDFYQLEDNAGSDNDHNHGGQSKTRSPLNVERLCYSL